MKNQSAEKILATTIERVRDLVDVSTIVGEPITINADITIIPISKVTVGYVVGGGEYADLSARRVANHFPMAGGSSGGMSVTPVGFLVVANGDVKFINVENKTLYQTVLNMFNTLLNKINEKHAEQEEQGDEE